MPRSLGKHVAALERERRRKKRSSLAWLRHVNVIDFLENFDLANVSQIASDEVLFSCPFSGHTHGDSTPSACMNDGSKDPNMTTLWTCYGCKRGGNAVSFLAEYNNISKQQASREIREHYAPGYMAPKYGSIAREFEERRKTAQKRNHVTTVPSLDAEIIRKFDVDWGIRAEYYDRTWVAYMLDRGFTPATLDEWGIGYDHSSKRITIPVCDANGKLVGFKGRAWRKDARPKYLVLGDKDERQRYGFPTFDKSLIVFGLDRYAASDSQTLVLVEGEIDVMSLSVMDIAAICVGGSSMSTAQAKLIREYCDELVLFFDNDVAGKHAMHGIDKQDGEHKPGIIELLEPFLRIRVVGRHRYDANEYLVRGERDRVRHLIDSAISSYVL